MTEAALVEYRELARRALAGESVTIDEIDNFLVPTGGLDPKILPIHESTREALLDCFHAVRLIEGQESAHPWNQGPKLKEAGRHLEAGIVYLQAADLLFQHARDGRHLVDHEDTLAWAQAALYHAANELVAAGRPLTGALVVNRITDDEYRKGAAANVTRVLDG